MTWNEIEDNAYVPYSKKPKYCVVKGTYGLLYAGVRVENISFPLTITAVQAAICICLSEKDTPASLFTPFENLEQLALFKHIMGLDISHPAEVPAGEFAEIRKTAPKNSRKLLTGLALQAIVPNSNFPVSTFIQNKDIIITGVNIEFKDNWTAGLCAERVALAKAVSFGLLNTDETTSLYVYTKNGEFSSPCGACRQVLTEHLPYHKIYLNHKDGTTSQYFTLDLMPVNFRSNFLSDSNSS